MSYISGREIEQRYIEYIQMGFGVSAEATALFERISALSFMEREIILKDVNTLRDTAGLSYALLALYRQQVNSGFVFADPLRRKGIGERRFHDPETGITFNLLWNPDRELRKDHAKLIERGVIAKDVDKTKLVNRNNDGVACYLCKSNIDTQNPREVLLEIELAGDTFYVGANFAYITNNHFTVMNATHRPQQYRPEIPAILNDFVDKTDGCFRAIFNGLAGASILEHEHIQATTEEFPIERIKIGKRDVVYRNGNIMALSPRYYLPIWIIEGRNKADVNLAADRVIRTWHNLNIQYHTINIISTMERTMALFRTFVILRDKRRLINGRKTGAMAAFEAGGSIILSCKSMDCNGNKPDEEYVFNNADLETLKEMLKGVSPDGQYVSRLSEAVTFCDI